MLTSVNAMFIKVNMSIFLHYSFAFVNSTYHDCNHVTALSLGFTIIKGKPVEILGRKTSGLRVIVT